MNKITSIFAFLLITNTVFSQFNLDSGLVLYVNFNQDSIEELSILKSPVHVYGDTAKFNSGDDLTQALRVDGKSAIQVELDTIIYSASVWVKTDIEVDNNLDKWFSVLQFYEIGTESSVNTAGLYVGPSSVYSNIEEVVINKSIKSQNYNLRTMSGNLGLDDQWHHYLMNYNDSTSHYDIYVDGVRTTTFVGTSSGHTDLIKAFNPVIGVRYFSNGTIRTQNTGLIDEVRMYNRSLTRTEIVDLSETYKISLNEDLIVYLDFEGNYEDKSQNKFSTSSIGTVEVLSDVDNSFLSFEENSGVKILVPDTLAYSASFYVRSPVRVDELDNYIIPLQFRESGTPSAANGVITFLGEGTILESGEMISLGETISSSNKFYRTMVRNVEFDDQWHHVLYNFNGTFYEIFLDGVLQNSTIGSSSKNVPLINMFNPVVGTRLFANNGFSTTSKKGWIDEVRIYGRSLTNIEIEFLSKEKEFSNLVASNKTNLEIGNTTIFPTIVEDNMVFHTNEEIVSASFYTIEGRLIASVSDLNTFDSSLLSTGLNYVVIEFVNGEKKTQKIIKK